MSKELLNNDINNKQIDYINSLLILVTSNLAKNIHSFVCRKHSIDLDKFRESLTMIKLECKGEKINSDALESIAIAVNKSIADNNNYIFINDVRVLEIAKNSTLLLFNNTDDDDLLCGVLCRFSIHPTFQCDEEDNLSAFAITIPYIMDNIVNYVLALRDYEKEMCVIQDIHKKCCSSLNMFGRYIDNNLGAPL